MTGTFHSQDLPFSADGGNGKQNVFSKVCFSFPNTVYILVKPIWLPRNGVREGKDVVNDCDNIETEKEEEKNQLCRSRRAKSTR